MDQKNTFKNPEGDKWFVSNQASLKTKDMHLNPIVCGFKNLILSKLINFYSNETYDYTNDKAIWIAVSLLRKTK